jgi:lipoic acid synthetase
VRQVMRDLRAHHVDILTLGQYLRPSLKHLPIIRYIPLEEFAEFKRFGYELGFSHVESGPLVRSSYHASDAVYASRRNNKQNLRSRRMCKIISRRPFFFALCIAGACF